MLLEHALIVFAGALHATIRVRHQARVRKFARDRHCQRINNKRMPIRSDIDQPTTLWEIRSITAAKYNQPSNVAMPANNV